jgi:hypothetical protein
VAGVVIKPRDFWVTKDTPGIEIYLGFFPDYFGYDL